MKVNSRKIEGYAYGAIQPSIILTFSDFLTKDNALCNNLEKLLQYLPRFEDPKRFAMGNLAIKPNFAPFGFMTLLDTLNRYCGDQRFTPIRVLEEKREALSFALPTLSTDLNIHNMNTIQTLLDMIKHRAAGDKVQKFLSHHEAKVRNLLPAGTNTVNFIIGAAELKIPFKTFNRSYTIFGYGNGSRIFNSSVTDEESAIGLGLAKSKFDTNHLLRMSGIPVAEQARIRTLQDARRFASIFDYPVVLKPESEEQGRGVFANIVNDAELKQCWTELSQENYKSILIEKHVQGNVYRVNTVEGKVVRVVKRIPALLVGDGTSTIAKLLDDFNKDPLRTDRNSSMTKIDFDADVVRTLTKQFLNEHSIPERGKVVYLTSVSSVSRGGHSIDFFKEFHPDNFVLCETVARVMRLNLTGIDVIAVDASQSWRDGGFFICEVNAKPQLGVSHMHIYKDFIAQKIKVTPYTKLVVSAVSSRVNGLLDTSCDRMEIVISPESVLREGCPVQYFDELKISHLVSDEDRQKIEQMLVSVKPELSNNALA